MFDPHRTRRRDSRYFTRKGQVLQASRVNTNPVIDQRLVPIYKNYLIKNNLIALPGPIPPTPTPVNYQIDRINITAKEASGTRSVDINLTDMTVFTEPNKSWVITPTKDDQVAIILYINTSGDIHFKLIPFGNNPNPFEVSIINNVKCYYALVDGFDALNEGIFYSTKTLFSNNKAILIQQSQSEASQQETLFISHELPISI